MAEPGTRNPERRTRYPEPRTPNPFVVRSPDVSAGGGAWRRPRRRDRSRIARHAVGPAVLARDRGTRSPGADLSFRVCGRSRGGARPCVPPDHVADGAPPTAVD